MGNIGTFAAIFCALFVVVFLIAFLWGVARGILRWTVIAAAAYVAVVITIRAAHVGGDRAPLTIADLLAATSGPHCSVTGSATSRSRPCTSAAR